MRKNENIQFFRAIFILIIIFFHYIYRFGEIYNIRTINFPTLSRWGMIGVGCFFIISGFLMIPKKKNEDFSILKYFLKKILRILPSYILIVSIIFLIVSILKLPGREVNFFTYLLNLSLLNGFIGVEYVDGAHWYLTYLILFYLIAGIYIKYFYNKTVFFVALIIIKDLFYLLSFRISFFSIFYNLLGQNYLEFIFLGVLLKDMLISNKLEKSKKNICYIFFCFIHFFFFNGKTCAFCYLLFITIFILLFINKKEVKFKIFNRIGDISFILYLIHQNIGYAILLRLCNYYGSYSIIFPFVTFLFVLFLSFIIYELFEKKIQLKIKKWISTK